MSTKMSSSMGLRPAGTKVDERYTRPQGLYHHGRDPLSHLLDF